MLGSEAADVLGRVLGSEAAEAMGSEATEVIGRMLGSEAAELLGAKPLNQGDREGVGKRSPEVLRPIAIGAIGAIGFVEIQLRTSGGGGERIPTASLESRHCPAARQKARAGEWEALAPASCD